MTGQDRESEVGDPVLLAAAEAVIAQHGVAGLTLERLAEEAGTSRMTLHRRRVTLPGVLAGLTARAAVELRDAYWPVLISDGTGAERLRRALETLCATAEDHLGLLAGLYAADGGVFHDPPDEDGAVPTRENLIAPLAKLLRDGVMDGSLRSVDDPELAAALLFNTLGWSYVHLRYSQHWPADLTRGHLVDLLLTGMLASG